MPRRIQLTLPYDEELSKVLDQEHPGWQDFRVVSQSLDARGANRDKKPTYHYQIDVIFKGEVFEPYQEEFDSIDWKGKKPIIIGAGPAGLFCALRLAEYGIASVLIERGERANERMRSIARYWRYGELNQESNVCFGEGGAGLFSDGKLITRIKSPHVQYVMNRFVDFGAPKETAYVSNPHLGSNKIRTLIGNMTDYLSSKGCELHFKTKVVDLLADESGKICGVKTDDNKLIHADQVVLATGHSAHDIYQQLKLKNVAIKSKDFAVGVRVEHPRRLIDKLQYGKFAGDKKLGTARYRLSWHDSSAERGSYSFCMCPGGYVLSSGTEQDGIVTNGMSNFARNSPWSNAALVVSVKSGRDFDSEDPLAGLTFQRSIESKAFAVSKELASGKELPSQRIADFVEGKKSSHALPKTSCPSGTVSYDLEQLLPPFVTNQLRKALTRFDRQMKGFSHSPDGLLLAPETRTSAPVTIERDKEDLESTSHPGLFPCGEGAGHAGGITSAAVDGVKVAERIVSSQT